MAITRCCGCWNLRQGTMASAIYTIVLGLLGIGACVLYLTVYLHVAEDKLNEDFDKETVDTVTDIFSIALYISISLYSMWVLSAVLIFVGLQTNKRMWMLPWMIMTGIVIGLSLYGIISNVTKLEVVFRSAISVVSFVINIILVLVNFYASMCVAAFFRQHMKEAGEVTDGLVLNQNAGVPTYAPPAYDAQHWMNSGYDQPPMAGYGQGYGPSYGYNQPAAATDALENKDATRNFNYKPLV